MKLDYPKYRYHYKHYWIQVQYKPWLCAYQWINFKYWKLKGGCMIDISKFTVIINFAK